MNMMRNLWLVAIVSMVMTIVACGGKGNETPANPKAPVPPKEIISDKTNVEVGAAQFYGNIMSMLGNFDASLPCVRVCAVRKPLMRRRPLPFQDN